MCGAVTPGMDGLVAVGMGARFAYCPVGHADTALHNDIVAIGMGARFATVCGAVTPGMDGLVAVGMGA